MNNPSVIASWIPGVDAFCSCFSSEAKKGPELPYYGLLLILTKCLKDDSPFSDLFHGHVFHTMLGSCWNPLCYLCAFFLLSNVSFPGFSLAFLASTGPKRHGTAFKNFCLVLRLLWDPSWLASDDEMIKARMSPKWSVYNICWIYIRNTSYV